MMVLHKSITIGTASGTMLTILRNCSCSCRYIPIRKIVHVGAYRDAEASNIHDMYEEFEYGFFNVVHLVKGLVKARLDQPVQLVLVACNAYRISGEEQRLLPHHATVLSLGKVIEQEIPNISCRAIDTD